MARRKSAARPAPRPTTQKRPASTLPPTKPAQKTNVPAVPPKQPTALANQKQPGLFGQVEQFLFNRY